MQFWHDGRVSLWFARQRDREPSCHHRRSTRACRRAGRTTAAAWERCCTLYRAVDHDSSATDAAPARTSSARGHRDPCVSRARAPHPATALANSQRCICDAHRRAVAAIAPREFRRRDVGVHAGRRAGVERRESTGSPRHPASTCSRDSTACGQKPDRLMTSESTRTHVRRRRPTSLLSGIRVTAPHGGAESPAGATAQRSAHRPAALWDDLRGHA